MDIGVTAILGTVWRWLFDAIKHALGLKDQAAEWMMLILSLVLAVIYNVITGGFSGIAFNVHDPLSVLGSVGSAWAVIVATAKAWYGVTKKRK